MQSTISESNSAMALLFKKWKTSERYRKIPACGEDNYSFLIRNGLYGEILTKPELIRTLDLP